MGVLDSALNEQRNLVVRKFARLAEQNRLLGMLEGNHEESIKKHHQYDIMQDICGRLKVQNLGYSCFYRLYLTRGKHASVITVDIYAHHGHGACRRTGGSINRFDDVMRSYDADIYLMGHDHKKWGKREVRLSLTKSNKLTYKPILIGRTGTFLKTSIAGHTTYAEKANYPPTDLGVIKITMTVKHTKNAGRDDRHELDMHISE